VYGPVREYFEDVKKLCETMATVTVRVMCGLKNSTDDIDVLYLPTHMSLRGCFASYLSRLGYSVEFFNDGNYRVGEWSPPSHDEDGDESIGAYDSPPPYTVCIS
jgi:nucleosome binding factor SPN SPT16 subunit